MRQVLLLSVKQKLHMHMNCVWSLESVEPVLRGSERKGSWLHSPLRMDSQHLQQKRACQSQVRPSRLGKRVWISPSCIQRNPVEAWWVDSP